MEFTQHTVINAPVDQVDLKEWLFTLSDSEYQATAKGNKAAGTFTTDGVRGMVNVESIGNVIVVQHYLAVRADSTHMEMLSERSLVYLLHLIPTPVWVRWTMTAVAKTEDTTTLSCTVQTRMPPPVASPRRYRGSITSCASTWTRKPWASPPTSPESYLAALNDRPLQPRRRHQPHTACSDHKADTETPGPNSAEYVAKPLRIFTFGYRSIR